MRNPLLIACFLLLMTLSGCRTLLFGIFGDSYSGGGDTRAEKEDHYYRQFDSSEHYQPWSP